MVREKQTALISHTFSICFEKETTLKRYYKYLQQQTQFGT
jgi:hypothetical protein